MRSWRIAASAAILAFALAGAPASGQTALGQGKVKSAPEASPAAAISSQPGAGAPLTPGISGQGTEPGSTLEIGPQLGANPPPGGIDVIPNHQPSSESESVSKFEPRQGGELESQSGARPYIGITVKYRTLCYLGKEEHGLEIMTVDPDSPAARAGLHGATGPSALGVAGMTAGELLGPLTMLTTPLLNRAGALGKGGDMIVAVDDHRVRTEQDFQRALARMKPGDTTYLTVIRPLPGGQGHKTLKIAVHLGAMHYANAGGGP